MDNLKKLRLERGMSQQALASQLLTSQQSIYKYENRLTEPNIDMLKSMADFFQVSIDYLIGYSSCAHKVEEVKDTELNEEELLFLQKFRLLPPTTKRAFLQLMDEFLQNCPQ